MATIDTQNTSYQRGLVLGLTMAEIAILIIFVLLLAFAALLAGQRDKREESEQQLEKFQEAARMSGFSPEPEAVKDALKSAREYQEAARMSGFSPEPEAVKNALKSAREYEEIKSVVKGTLDGGKDINELKRELIFLDETKQQLEKFQEAARVSGFSPEPEAVKNALKSAREYEEIKSAGKGTEVPSCWTSDNGTVEYIYEVNLTSTGLVIRETDLVHRSDARQMLPIQNVILGQDISERDFLSFTSELFKWSKSQECRFFVRVFDSTGPTQKAVYQSRLKAVEARFYKFISKESF